MTKTLTVLIALLFAAQPVTLRAQYPAPTRPFGTLREQAALQQQWLQERLDVVLPALMREHGVEMWLIAMREYNEDPLFRGLVAATSFAARRRTVYIFHDRGLDRGVERIALGGGSQGGVYQAVRATELAPDGRQREFWGPDQWDAVARAVRERDPRTIAVNMSQTHNFADGLSAGEWELLREALGPDLVSRVRRAETLALDYLAVRVTSMDSTYRDMQALVHELIAGAFSSAVIAPGVTTTDDVVWWFRQRVNDLGLGTWFHPTIDVQRHGVEMGDSVAPVILRGDVLHCDVGLTALRLNTDTQHMGYVLAEGETDAPEGLRLALATANRLQDIVMAELRPGLTGNEILHASLAAMREAGIDGTVYTHPIGDHGHGAGPLIGLWDRQDGVPGRGDVRVRPSTWYSIELQATSPVPEWGGQQVRMMLEEDAALGADGTSRWVLRRQNRLHLVR
ncbi:MAG: aminopeptidase P family protein [Gemmatimonadota bacterium]|nr:aminopeptidase P family protein [Gemmatimonadota bacterium]MDH3368595.1 aminopeptidase P family protein [Gemmatimonadota bacterium]MDH3477392.1 aminopeptidase P family protein [Gemmatimonadota bacterium]MDH3570411.1 aminopeptidase P family protein [Gemmatimonadota bacterium]